MTRRSLAAKAVIHSARFLADEQRSGGSEIWHAGVEGVKDQISSGIRTDCRFPGAVWIGVVVAFAMAACTTSRLEHEAYVWKRHWTDQTYQAISALADDLTGLRVLVVQVDSLGKIQSVRNLKWPRYGRPVTAVMRIDGTGLSVSAEKAHAALAEAIDAMGLVSEQLLGIEIDHDAPTGRLSQYAQWLDAFRDQASLAPRLSITTLPDWLHSQELPGLLARVDSAVVQVHAVDAPEMGLLDVDQALQRLHRFAAISPAPFQVALPTYWLRAGKRPDGRVLFVEAEVEVGRRARAENDLAVDPRALEGFLSELERKRPRGLTGVVWFRLPEAGDRRVFSSATFRALIRGNPIVSSISLEQVPSAAAGHVDLVLRNTGIHEGLSATYYPLPSGCQYGEGVAGYRWRSQALMANHGIMLKPAQALRIGWASCSDQGDTVTLTTASLPETLGATGQ